MGNLPKEHYTYHSKQKHPIQGIVPVWSIKNQGKFVMRLKVKPQRQRIDMFQQIAEEESFHLLKYFGNIYADDSGEEMLVFSQIQKKGKKEDEKDQQMQIKDKSSQEKSETSSSISDTFSKLKTRLKIKKDEKNDKNAKMKAKGIIYWEFLNYDLSTLLQDKRKQNPQAKLKQDQILQIIDACANAGKVLASHNIFLDFNLKIIQLSASKMPQIYWAHILPHNLHKTIIRHFQDNKHPQVIENCYYSPEQLQCLFKQKPLIPNYPNITNPYLMEKCSVFSLGMVLLQMMTLLPSKQIYNYEKFSIDSEQLAKRLYSLKSSKVYNANLRKTLKSMLKKDVQQRCNFNEILGMLYG